MTKFWLLCIFIIIDIVSCKPIENKISCGKFREGRFRYCGYTIERDESIQVEKDGIGGTITKKIKWISDGEYELTFLSARQKDTLPGRKLIVYERKEKVQKFKIIETARDFYIFETVTSKGDILRDTVWLLRIGGFKSIGDVFPVKK